MTVKKVWIKAMTWLEYESRLNILERAVFAGYFEQSHFKNDRPAILFSESAEVKSEPQAASPNVIMLHEGAKVYVLETLEQWRKVQLTDGTEGWLNANAIREVK